MLDLELSKLALIGAVALVVLGPEKMPRLARTLGTMVGRAQRYVRDVQAEVKRSMEVEELQKMKSSVDATLSQVQGSVLQATQNWNSQVESWHQSVHGQVSTSAPSELPHYQHPGKKWRVRRAATPQWYKVRHGVRSRALSGAARVARFRPTQKGR